MHHSKTSAPRANQSDTLDGLAHDARNVISGLMLYCELLSLPGVLNKSHGHYARDLESIVTRASRMIERMAETAAASRPLPAASSASISAVTVPLPVKNAAEELRHAQPLLAAIAGPAVQLSIATMPCAGQTALAVEDLTRILVNLVRNAADAMPSGGHIRITAQYGDGTSSPSAPPSHVLITVTDNGPGISESLRAQIFDRGFSTRSQTKWRGSRVARSRSSDIQVAFPLRKSHPAPSPKTDTSTLEPLWPSPRRGLGLSIVRNLVEAAGGSVTVHSAPGTGARFEIRLPLVPADAAQVTSGTCPTQPQSGFSADARGKGCIKCQ